MFRGIYKMPAGCRAFVEPDGTMKAEAYWDALPGRGDDVAELQRLSGAGAARLRRARGCASCSRRPSRSG